MSQDEYNVAVSASNGRPQRLVSVERIGGSSFRDKIDPNSSTSRGRLINKASVRLGVVSADLDWLDDAIVDAADRADEEADRDLRDEVDNDRKSTADLLVELALERYRIGRSTSDEPFAVEIQGPNVALMFRGSRDALRSALSARFRQVHGRTPNSSALTDALTALHGEAFAAEPEEIHLRVAEHGNAIVIDLGDSSGRAVVVRPAGWEVVERSPVLFRRTAASGALPVPIEGSALKELRDLINVSDETWPLVVGWLIACFVPNIPHPILLLGGQQGTGKTTAARHLGGLVDPSPAQLRSQPRDPETWAISASASWLVSVDNISMISDWWSDSLCKAVTGDGWLRRKLYTDGDLAVLAFRRVVLLTSIDPGALRGDLGDRVLLVDLEKIDQTTRKTERDIEGLYQTARPRLLGALLDQLARVLSVLPTVSEPSLPRMADFARLLAAVDRTGSYGKKSAFDIYMGQAGRVAETVIESDPVALAIESLVNGEAAWNGTASELLAKITPEHPLKDWPRTPQRLGGRLTRLIPALEHSGITITYTREGHDRTRRYHITRAADETRNSMSALSAPSACSENAEETTGDVRTTADGCGQEGTPSRPQPDASLPDENCDADKADNADNDLQSPSNDGFDAGPSRFRSLCAGRLGPEEVQRLRAEEKASSQKERTPGCSPP